MLIELLKAILFGIVEGITEWLPVSSTGHMLLLNQFVSFDTNVVSEGFYSMYEVVIQLGAILAVVVLFWNRIFPWKKSKKTGRVFLSKKTLKLWGKILLACVPAAVIGVLFDEKFEALFYHPIPIAIALIVFGVAFILIETFNGRRKPAIRTLNALDIKTVLLIGVFQVLAAVFPGTSRSGATIVGALLLGVSRPIAAEFTFFLAIPVMFGASALKLVKFGLAFSGAEALILLLSMVVAFAVSMLVIKFLMDYIKKHDFKAFGWYRIALGILVILYFGLVK